MSKVGKKFCACIVFGDCFALTPPFSFSLFHIIEFIQGTTPTHPRLLYKNVYLIDTKLQEIIFMTIPESWQCQEEVLYVTAAPCHVQGCPLLAGS